MKLAVPLRVGLRRFVEDESGATAIEYGLIATLIALVIIGGLNVVGGKLNNIMTKVGNKLG